MDTISRNITVGNLLAIYGGLLTERQHRMLDLHYNHDLSLAEIAEQEQISRQAVHDALQRGENSLYRFERMLQMEQKQQSLQKDIKGITDNIKLLNIENESKQMIVKWICDLKI